MPTQPSEAPGPRKALEAASEDVVLTLARSGDLVAFEVLVCRRQGQVRALLRRLSNDAALADDLSQETFVRAWQGLASLRADAAFWSWLRRIAVRTWARHAQRRPPAADVDLGDLVDVADTAPDSDPAAAGASRDLDAALARLAGPARNCMVLAYQAGMPHVEIASVLGLPLGTVKSHITRSTQLLRRWLGAGTTG